MAAGFPGKVIHGGTGKRQREKTQKKILDFSASVNPFPPRFEWHIDPEDLSLYPDDSYNGLKEQIGRAFNRDPDEICVGNGSIEIIRVFCNVVLGRTERTRYYFLEPPTFGEYELSARLAGAERTDEAEKADVHFICNPNNPTGTLQRRSDLLCRLRAIGEHGGILFCDEAFIGLADPAESLADVRDNALFVLHSLTKSFAVPGLRMGFGFGSPGLVEKIETARSPWCVNAYAEAFAMEALLHLDDLARSRAEIAAERNHLQIAIERMGLSCRPSSANYLLIDCGRAAGPLCATLLRRGILVRDCTSFDLADCIRVAVRTPEENLRLIGALESCLH